MVLRGRVKSGRESSSPSFCISVTKTRDTSSGASGVSGVPLSSVSEASLSKSGRISVLSSALAGVAVSAANAGILPVKKRKQARQPPPLLADMKMYSCQKESLQSCKRNFPANGSIT